MLLLAIMLVISGCTGGGVVGDKSYSVSGKVVDTDNKGIQGVTLSFTGGSTGTATTNEQGIWQATLKGTVTITPVKDGYSFEPGAKQVKGQATNVDFIAVEVDKPYPVSGSVVDLDGKGVEGATLTLTGDSTGTVRTNEQGVWQATIRGIVTITPSKDGYSFEPGAKQVKGQATNVDFLAVEVDKPYTVSGSIVDLDGKGVEGVTLIFTGNSTGTARTNDQGRWQATLEGIVTITPNKDGYTFEPGTKQVKGQETNADFTALAVDIGVEITEQTNYGYGYNGEHYPSGFLNPVSFLVNGVVRVEVDEAFAAYPDKKGIYGVLYASDRVTVFPKINGQKVLDKRVQGQGVIEFSFDNATSLYVSGESGEVYLYAFPVPLFQWDSLGTTKTKLPVDLVTKTASGRYNAFIVSQAPHTYIHQDSIAYQESVYKNICPLKPLEGEYSKYNGDFIPTVQTVHFLSELPLIIQCSAPRIEDYEEEYIHSAQMKREVYSSNYEFWVMSDCISSCSDIVQQAVNTSLNHAANNYLPENIQLDKIIIYGVSGEIADEMGHSYAVSDYDYEEQGFKNHIGLNIENWSQYNPKYGIVEVVSHEIGHILHFSCYACGPLIPYSWFCEGIAQIFSSEVLEINDCQPLGLPGVSSSGYEYVSNMEKYLYVDWTNWHGHDLGEISIWSDEYEIGLNFMAYLKETYGNDVLRNYFLEIGPKILSEIYNEGSYGSVWYQHNITCWDTLKDVTSPEVYKGFKDWYDTKHSM